MTYHGTIQKIDDLMVFGSRPGLDRITKLLELMGNPQDNLKYVHVAGTNGKGSVCYMLANILKEAKYKTGLFTSPHITGFCERMQINGNPISEDDVIRIAEKIFPLVEQMRKEGDIITEFEFVTAMMFSYFNEQKCDIVVMETGLGGRLDATNVIKRSECSIITTISYDHTAVLGDTLEQITKEKCGIIKPDSKVVFSLQESEVNQEVISAVADTQSSLYTSNGVVEVVEAGLSGTKLIYDNKNYTISMIGTHQIKNFRTVLTAVDVLRTCGFSIPHYAVVMGIGDTKIPARMEIVQESPLVVIDGCHNPSGMMALSHTIDDYFGNKKIICVLGMLKDKDFRQSVSFLKGKVERIITTTVPDNPRNQTAQELKDGLEGLGIDITPCESPTDALNMAKAQAESTPDSMVIVCGSLYLSAYLRSLFF